MAEEPTATNEIRSDLVDTAIGFLKNPKIAVESMEKKRSFLQKKGLNENEIAYAFKIIPQPETSTAIVPNHRPSFLRRILADLILAGLIGYAIKLIKRWLGSKQTNQINSLNETIKNLQKTVQDMQTSIGKLEQAADQLHLTMHSTTNKGSSLEEVKNEIQLLKGLLLNRSQFPSVPKAPPTLPAWQLEKSKARSSPVPLEINSKTNNDDNKEDADSIVLVSESDKKSDDETRLSTSASSSDA